MSDELLQELLARVRELQDREAIRELKARYFRFLDAQDWQGFRQCFADDAWFDVQGRELIHGADPFVVEAQNVLGEAQTLHHGHMPEITIDSATEAHGLWMLADYLEWPSEPGSGERRGMKGYWRYEEEYRKIDGAWKIATLRLRPLRIDPLPREPLPDQIIGGPARLGEPTPQS
jgi:SnoaL-like domain